MRYNNPNRQQLWQQIMSDVIIVVIDEISGFCPVQAEGTVGGLEFYFRARGTSWTFSLGSRVAVAAPEWFWEEQYGDGEPFAAGWMTLEEAKGFIEKAVRLWAQGEPSKPCRWEIRPHDEVVAGDRA